eukprot:8698438-Pyramimonas_sp.AAC.1
MQSPLPPEGHDEESSTETAERHMYSIKLRWPREGRKTQPRHGQPPDAAGCASECGLWENPSAAALPPHENWPGRK